MGQVDETWAPHAGQAKCRDEEEHPVERAAATEQQEQWESQDDRSRASNAAQWAEPGTCGTLELVQGTTQTGHDGAHL